MVAANDRALNSLYLGLIPLERARLLAKLWREHDTRELNRLRRTIPDDEAGRAYNRAVRIIRQLHGSTGPTLLALTTGIDLDLWRLLHCYDVAADRCRARALCHLLWKLLGYPATEAEHRSLVAIERDEPLPLDAYAELLADRDGDEAGLHPAVAALLRSLPDDLARLQVPDDRPPGEPPPEEEWREDVRRAEEIARRLRRVIDAAVERGELPKPRRTAEGLGLAWGVLHDWGEGTTEATYRPFPPAYHVPGLELLEGGAASWDVRPDEEADEIKARRAELLKTLARIVADAWGVEGLDLGAVTLEPPASPAERERAVEDIAGSAPWRIDGVRDDVRWLTAQHAGRRAELRAYRDVIDQFRQAVFGGEDPLDPLLRALLDDAWATEERFEQAWTAATDWMKPYSVEEDQDWPPPFEDEDRYADARPHLEEHLRGEWNV